MSLVRGALRLLDNQRGAGRSIRVITAITARRSEKSGLAPLIICSQSPQRVPGFDLGVCRLIL